MEPIALPRPPAEPEPGAFPLLASLAPVLGAAAMWLVLQSPAVLAFALLGPLIALASLGDGRRTRRRRRRREAERWRRELEEVSARVDAALAERADRLRAEHPGARTLAGMPAHDPRRWRRADDAAVPVVLGVGERPSGIRLEGEVRASDPAAVRSGAVDDAARLRERAAVLDGPLVVDARDGVGLVGPAAAAVARTAVVQVLEAVPPGAARVVAPEDPAWDWLALGPHELHREPGSAVRVVGDGVEATVAVAASPEGLPRECRAVVRATLDEVRCGDAVGVPEALSAREAAEAASTLRDAAARAGLGPASGPPPHVALAQLEQPRGGLAARFLVADAPIDLDLVRDGPHAVVGGTTGSGKSELLIAWIAAMAAGRSTEEVAFLLVDFKGGASFAALAGLAHCVGVMTDLDERGARRAIESLRAELRRRERVLAEQGAREIGEARGLPRLVIVVDELAAMLDDLPDLHRLLVDLAARGRSLGVHLVLCTQRPAEAVRDALLANCGIRISLRVTGEQDAIAVTGTPEAARIGLEARGRCVVRVSGGATRLAQAALAEPEALARLVAASAALPAPARPWREPLPELLPLAAATAAASGAGDGPEGVVLGLVDRPAAQAVDPVLWRPERDGPLLAIGSASSGRTALADLVAGQLGTSVVDREDALWDALADGGPLVVDDVDLLLARLGEEHQQAVAQGLATAMRSGRPVALTARRATSAMAQLAPLAELRVLLRIASRQEHVVAGGAGGTHDAGLPPGGGWIDDERVQLALPPAPAPRRAPRAVPLPEGPLAVVLGPAAALPPALAAGAVAPGAPGADAAPVVAGAAHEWEAAWGELDRLRRVRPVLALGVDARQLRQALRHAPLPPPTRGEPAWLIDGGAVLRLR